MGKRFPGGVISKTPPTVTGPAPGTGGSASGVWSLDEVLGYVKAGVWPGEPLPIYKLYAWGFSSDGANGTPIVTGYSSPVQVGAEVDWYQISATFRNTGAVKTDGTLWTFGTNGQGQLGHNDTVYRSSPVQVGALTDWATVSVGGTNSTSGCAAMVKTNGTLWGMGNSLFLGNAGNRSSPVQIGVATNWAKVVAYGYNTGIAIKTNGTLWTWGGNASGLNANNTTVGFTYSPTQVGSLTNWATPTFCGAIKTDGTLWRWGPNSFGQLGLGDRINRSSPVQVGALTDWTSIPTYSSVGIHFAAVRANSLFTWGGNYGGVLGINSTTPRSSPVQVGALTNWATVGVHHRSSFAVKTDGTLWSWGYNNSGTLGQNTPFNAPRSSPVQVGAETNWLSVVGGGEVRAMALAGG